MNNKILFKVRFIGYHRELWWSK